jgi:hypothetical protein
MEIVRDKLQGNGVSIPAAVQAMPLGAVIARATRPQRDERHGDAAEMRAAIGAATTQPGFQSGVVAVTGEGAQPLTHSQAMAATGAVSLGAFVSAPTGGAGVEPISAAHWAAAQTTGATAPPVPPGGVSWNPQALPHAPSPYGPSFPMGPPPQAGASWGWVVAALAVVLVLFGSGAVWLMASAAKPATSRATEETEADAPIAETPDDEPGSVATPTDDTPATSKRLRACAGLRAVTKPLLKRELQALGWSGSRTLIYCPGNMVNFRCLAAQTDGVTVEHASDGKGSLALMRFPSATKAEDYLQSESSAVTLAHAKNVVLRIELPDEAADALTARICR